MLVTVMKVVIAKAFYLSKNRRNEKKAYRTEAAYHTYGLIGLIVTFALFPLLPVIKTRKEFFAR
jgi:hypothetical protein